jgi:hypothetical protein
MRQPLREDLPAPARNLVLIGRYLFEGGDAVKDVMPVYGGDFAYVVVAR